MNLMNRYRRMIALSSCCAVWCAPTFAFDMKAAVQEAALRNPEVLNRWDVFNEASENIGVAEGGYLPKVDVSTGIKRESLRQPGIERREYTTKGASLYLDQMLFDGFATQNDVKRLSYAQRVRYFEFLDTTESVALEAIRAYVDVMRYRTLAKLAEENYIQHRAIHEQIRRRVKAGVGRQVDLEQAGGRLGLAESNLLVEMSNLHDVSARFERIVGKVPPQEMKAPGLLDTEIPPSKQAAVSHGYRNNAGLLAAQENIVATMAEADVTKAAFMPKVFLQARRDLGWDIDGGDGKTVRSSLGLVLNMNLYNGGSDSAKKRQYAERVNGAKDLRDKVCRDIRQTVTIAFNDIRKLAEQIEFLDQHQLATEKARDAYRKQFDIGQRTLLDLLDTENELFDARRAYQNALHDQVYAFARTQAGMGRLLNVLEIERLKTDRLQAQDEVAEFDPQAVCPPDEILTTSIDKDKIFDEAVNSRPELLPPLPAPKPEASPLPPKPTPKAAPSKKKPKR